MRTTGGRVTLFALLCAVAACVAASSAHASKGIQYGIQDDTWLEFGPGTLDQRLATFKRLGVPLVRFTLRWNEIALRRPKDPTSPSDRAYDWHRPDRILRGLRRHGLTPVLTLVGTPAWANGGRAPNFAPPHPRDFRRFATRRRPSLPLGSLLADLERAEQARSGSGRRSRAIYVQHLLNPGYEAIHAVLPHARVGGGVTGPRGANGGVSPVDWIRGMARAHAKLDAYAHHPYPATPSETPSSGGCKNCPWITMATIRKLLILVKRVLRVEADLADGVRLPDEPARHVPRRAAEAAGDDAQPRGDARVEAAAGDDVLPVPLSRRGRSSAASRAGSSSRTTARSRRCRHSSCRSRRWGDRGPGRSSGGRSAAAGPGERRTGSRCSRRTCGRRSGRTG